jgi:hypothetical protein
LWWWWRSGRGNRSTWRKPAPMPLCPPQIPLVSPRAAAVGSQWLTASAMARPKIGNKMAILYVNIGNTMEDKTPSYFYSRRYMIQSRMGAETKWWWEWHKEHHWQDVALSRLELLGLIDTSSVILLPGY